MEYDLPGKWKKKIKPTKAMKPSIVPPTALVLLLGYERLQSIKKKRKISEERGY